MPEIGNEAKIGCKYLTLADRGLYRRGEPNDRNNTIVIRSGVFDELNAENQENIHYILYGRNEITNSTLNPKVNLCLGVDNNTPVLKKEIKKYHSIVREVRNFYNNTTKNIYMFYSISDDNNNIKPIFVFLEQGSQAWNAAVNKEIQFAQLDDTVLSPNDSWYNKVKNFINNCFNADWNRNLANQVWPNCTEEYIKIPIESLPGIRTPIEELASILSNRLRDAGSTENAENAENNKTIVTINKFGLQYAKAIIDSQITNSEILNLAVPGEGKKYDDLRDSYRKNLESMKTLFRVCDIVRTYGNNVIDNNNRTPENNVVNINTPEAKCNENINKPRNLIVFGAPGTGKSYSLNDLIKNKFKQIERVTFYPSYSYSQFVGCYKPIMEGKNISYSFVPGPFLRTYVDAVKDPSKNYLLIIEEINRADAASVFGDVFQLLDRDQYGNSVYSISASEDIKKYLKEKEINSDKLSIPSNMYIWATMNSADQGVFPMDTAFKRRWDFLYFDLDGNPIGDEPNCPVTKSNWEDIRKAINEWLCEKKVNEDKHLGKYFLNVGKNVEEKDFRHAFKNKVLMYLYEDAARAFRSELFGNNSFSAILRDFNTIGTGIFKPESIKKSIAKRVDNGEVRANE